MTSTTHEHVLARVAHPMQRVLASKGRCGVTNDLTVRILTDIRDAARETNGRIHETNARLTETNARIDETNARLESLREELSRRIVESELRTATAITDLAGTVRDVATLLREQGDLRPRVERCERQIAALERRRRS
jgi:predicted nuclease with TOPRIM domain